IQSRDGVTVAEIYRSIGAQRGAPDLAGWQLLPSVSVPPLVMSCSIPRGDRRFGEYIDRAVGPDRGPVHPAAAHPLRPTDFVQCSVKPIDPPIRHPTDIYRPIFADCRCGVEDTCQSAVEFRSCPERPYASVRHWIQRIEHTGMAADIDSAVGTDHRR